MTRLLTRVSQFPIQKNIKKKAPDSHQNWFGINWTACRVSDVSTQSSHLFSVPVLGMSVILFTQIWPNHFPKNCIRCQFNKLPQLDIRTRPLTPGGRCIVSDPALWPLTSRDMCRKVFQCRCWGGARVAADISALCDWLRCFLSMMSGVKAEEILRDHSLWSLQSDEYASLLEFSPERSSSSCSTSLMTSFSPEFSLFLFFWSVTRSTHRPWLTQCTTVKPW